MGRSTKARVESSAAAMLAKMKGEDVFRDEPNGYTKLPENNLIPGVIRDDFWEDLSAGDGSELIESDGAPAKFCASFSSSVLAVNAFGPFRHAPKRLSLAGMDRFTEVQFEKKLPTGLKGTPPNLDFYASGPAGTVCVESKFLEPLSRKEAIFAASYKRVIGSLAEPAWQAMYSSLLKDPLRFRYLDAAQLVKHYLGMRNSLIDKNPLVLIYLFWEPSNASEIAEFVQHREEADIFSNEVQDSEVRFIAMSYPDLWELWWAEAGWSGMQAHLQLLRDRYSFTV